MSLSLSQQQGEAVRSFESWFKQQRIACGPTARSYVLGGYAGTGKSSILPNLIEATGLKANKIAIMAPTGKAVSVISKKLLAQGVAIEPSTIHSAIYRAKPLPIDALKEKVEKLEERAAAASALGTPDADLNEKLRIARIDLDRAYDNDTPNFQLNYDAQGVLNADLVIVDEASMVSKEIADDLRQFERPILAIGDPGQLPPVSGEPGFFNREPNFFLTEVHRQAKDNPILWLATLLREGGQAPLGTHGERLKVVTQRQDVDTFDITRDLQIIVGRNATRWQINREVRRLCGFGFTGPVPGELMICTRNSQKIPGLVNGSLVMCESSVGDLMRGGDGYYITIRDDKGQSHKVMAVQAILEENYNGKDGFTASKHAVWQAKGRFEHLDWASAITAHKSQGSQWDSVVVHDESACFREERSRWAYTAATRAAENLTWVV